MPRSPLPYALALLLPMLVACQAPPRSARQGASASVIADCRAQTDRVYTAQNRADLSREDQRNEPFAAGYVSGIVTSGLSQQYQRDNMVDSCVKANGGPAAVAPASVGPTFSPSSPHS